MQIEKCKLVIQKIEDRIQKLGSRIQKPEFTSENIEKGMSRPEKFKFCILQFAI